MNKKIFSTKVLAAGLIASFLSGTLLNVLPVEAMSAYDNVIHPTSRLELDSDECDPIDYTSNWESEFISESSTFNYSGTGMTKAQAVELFNNKTHWGVSQLTNGGQKTILIWWTDASVSPLNFVMDGGLYPSATIQKTGGGTFAALGILLTKGNDSTCFPISYTSNYMTSDSNWPIAYDPADENIIGFTMQPFFQKPSIVNYPSGYEGEEVPDSSEWADLDSDGLIAAQEATQGTSNANKDTDGDGLSDYVESQWKPDRGDIFCGTSCAYPSPTTKDLYIEIDWMKNGSRVIKPSLTQLSSVIDAYDDQDIIAHFDTGQYGGGNELPVYVNELYFESEPSNLDFYDLKSGNSTYLANFDSNRSRIWHYMISADKVKFKDPDNPSTYLTDSSGVSFAGDDDLAVAVGYIEDNPISFGYNSVDTALSGTIIHEVGHNLCLSNGSYTGQSANCQFNKIDTWASASYDSSMNYTTQMFKVDYSQGTNGAPDDHDDWSAVLGGGISNFANMDRNAGDSAGVASGTNKQKKLVRGITAKEAKALKKAGKLGGKYKRAPQLDLSR